MAVSFDAYPVKQRLADLDYSLVEAFLRKVAARGRITLLDEPSVNLVKMQLAGLHSPTLAGLLLFGDHGYVIRLNRRTAQGEISDSRSITGPLMKAVDEAMLFLGMHLRSSSRHADIHGGDETWRYPRKVVHELLVNAVIHRDYRHNAHIDITIFDDRMLFDSPGGIYGNQTAADLMRDDYVASFRNPRLAEAFFLMGGIEKYGSGLIRVRKLLEDDPTVIFRLEATQDGFKSEIRSRAEKETSESREKDLPQSEKTRLTDLENCILEEIRANPSISLDIIGSRLVISRNTVIEYVNRLEAKGMIRRKGGKQDGYRLI